MLYLCVTRLIDEARLFYFLFLVHNFMFVAHTASPEAHIAIILLQVSMI